MSNAKQFHTIRGTFLLGLMILLFVFSVNPAIGQESGTVHAVLFYSPTCPHCHYVINEVLPPLQEQFGDKLLVIYVDVTTQQGAEIFREAGSYAQVSPDRWGGVPTLIIGSTVLIGDRDIEVAMPDLVSAGIEAGGVPVPSIPKLQEAWAEAEAGKEEQLAENANSASESSGNGLTTAVEETWLDRFENDLVANSLAAAVLLFLIGSVIALFVTTRQLFETHQLPEWIKNHRERWIILGLIIVSVVVSGTLVLEQEGAPTLLALGVTLLLIVGLLIELRSNASTISDALFPIVAIAGVIVAGYLTYVEVGENDAVCGIVGNCNLVQESEYSEFLGLVPIGVLGIIGYVLILSIWGISLQAGRRRAQQAQVALLGLTLLGTIFSVYLTFLEPFVIGATCIWCLTSSLLMVLLLYLQVPGGYEAVQALWFNQKKPRRKRAM